MSLLDSWIAAPLRRVSQVLALGRSDLDELDYPMSTEPDPELQDLLAPLSEAAPCGVAMRYDPVFTEIRLAREEDDPSLPMGQWERPLKRADWALIETRCKQVLATQSKDLQLAVWLMEAWARQRGLPGLVLGLQLVDGLLARYWANVHPLIDEDGDGDARVAPLEWVNESLPLTLKLHVPLLLLPERKPSRLYLADWERLTASELQNSTPAEPLGDGPAPLTRAEVLAFAQQQAAPALRQAKAELHLAQSLLAKISVGLDAHMALDAPNFGKLKALLDSFERVLAQLLPKEAPVAVVVQPALALPPSSSSISSPRTMSPAMPHSDFPAKTNGWASRDEAYATLEALADYLGQAEPHSPTPYLIRRAVNWGRMSLPDLMAEVMREEGDLNRLTNLLGLREEDQA